MDRKDSSERNYEQEIDTLITSMLRMSKLAGDISSPAELQQMEHKKAAFVIKGMSKRYVFEIVGSQLIETQDVNNITTYCYCESAKAFLEVVDRILAGDSDSFQRALQRGIIVLKGKQSIHDQIMWKKGLERIAKLRKQYSLLG